MANHNVGGSSSFTSTASNGLLLPLGMLSSTRRPSNNHAQIHHQLPRVQSPTYGGQQHHHHHNHINQLSHHHHHHPPQHHHQQASPSVSQLPPLRSSSAMPQVNSRPQVRRRSNSVTANNNIISLNNNSSSSTSTNNNSNNNSSTANNNSSPVRPTVSTMADGRVLSGNSSSVTHGSSPTSVNSGTFSTVAGLPVGRPDMASATISPRIRRLVGSASSSRGATSVSSSSSSGGDENHRNRRSSVPSSHGRRRLSLDLSSIVPDHRRLRESLRERIDNAGHNSSSSMSWNVSNGVSSTGGNSNNDTIGKSSGVVASTSSVATPSPPPAAIDIRPTLNPIASCPVAAPVASSSRAPSVPPKSTNATSPNQAGTPQSSQLCAEQDTQQISGTDKSKLKGKKVNVKLEEPQDSSTSSDLYTAKNAASSSGGPASTVEMLSELEKELTCSICQSLYLNPVTLDCLHSYCGSCAKEWFEPPPPMSLSSASPTERGCPTCRQPVRTIKASAHLNSLTTIFLRHNPHLQRPQQELAELAKIYSPGDEILLERERTGHHRRDRNGDTRRAGDGWWDGLIEERERERDEEDEALQAAVRESMRDLLENSQSNRRRSGYQSLISSRLGRSSGSYFSSSRSLQQTMTGTISLGLTDRMEREISGVNVIPPPPPGALIPASRSTGPPRETPISCDSCGKSDIHTSVHFHCKQCRNDDFDLCLSCVRRGDRCQAGPSQVHDLEPRKFNPITNKLEKGFFCDNEFCSKNINDMFWHCRVCNGGKWDYCTACVNRGDCCSHDLEAMSCSPTVLADSGISSSSPTADSSSASRTLLNGAEASSNPMDDLTTPLGIARPLKLSTRCDLCHEHISSREEYFHCPSCHGGDWDCHRSCLQTINPSISSSHFQCPQSHSLQVIIQLPSPDNSQNPSTYLRRILTAAERPLAQRSYTYKASHGATVTLEPPRGDDGKCQKAQAIWAYWPETSRGDAGDELGFPRSAVIEDVLMVNREWWWGSYSGRQGLFPAVYVSLITGDATRA